VFGARAPRRTAPSSGTAVPLVPYLGEGRRPLGGYVWRKGGSEAEVVNARSRDFSWGFGQSGERRREAKEEQIIARMLALK